MGNDFKVPAYLLQWLLILAGGATIPDVNFRSLTWRIGYKVVGLHIERIKEMKTHNFVAHQCSGPWMMKCCTGF